MLKLASKVDVEGRKREKGQKRLAGAGRSNEDMVEAGFDWISEMRAGNLKFIIEVPNISLPHLEAWSHIKAWSEIITFEIEAPASIRGNVVPYSREYKYRYL